MTDLGFTLPRLLTVFALLLPACEGKDGLLTEHSTTASSTGEPADTSTSEPDETTDKPVEMTTTGPVEMTTTGPVEMTTTGPVEMTTTGPVETTGEPVDTTGDIDTGEPVADCEGLLTKAECDAVPPPEGFFHTPCAWADIELWAGDEAACSELTGAARCIPVKYSGEGCFNNPECAVDRLYYREVEPGTWEAFSHPTTCGLEPVGWQQCFEDSPAVCDCFCDSDLP
jgi:hypothetical protein